MYRQYLFYPGGELRAKGLQTIQDSAQEGVAAVGNDGLGSGSYYHGLAVSQSGLATVQIAPGRLWSEGQAYNLPIDSALPVGAGLVVQLADNLPLVQNKVVALCVWGEQVATNEESLSFIVDPVVDTYNYQSVPTRLEWLARITVVDDGTEAAAPVVPVIPDGLLHFATVWLDPDGITRIEMVEGNRLPRGEQIHADLDILEVWKAQIEAQISGLKDLFQVVRNFQFDLASLREVQNMAIDIANIRQQLDLPDTYSFSSADAFVDESNSDPSQGSYAARIYYGLLFPTEASNSIDLQLQSPASTLHSRSGNLVLPAYESVQRFSLTDWEGEEIPMAVEQSSWTSKTITLQSWVHKDGWSFSHYVDKWPGMEPHSYWPSRYGMTDYRVNTVSNASYHAHWHNDWNTNWTLEPVQLEVLDDGSSQTITGAAIAQTFIASAMWLTGIDLYFTQVESADVTVYLCPVSNTGKPLFEGHYASATMEGDDLNIHPAPTHFEFSTPIYLESGSRYALVVVSTAIQRLAIAPGKEYTEGSLFTSTSVGGWYEGRQDVDLLFALYAAKFRTTLTRVDLEPVSLAGGITDLVATLQKRVPQGTELTLQYRLDGDWVSMTEERGLVTDFSDLANQPTLLPLRAVFVGTRDVQPGLYLTSNAIEVSRSGTSLVHYSSVITIPTATDTFRVQIRTHRFQPATHTLVVKIFENGTEHDADISTLLPEPHDGHLHDFEFTLPAAVTDYQIKIEATRPGVNTEPFSIDSRVEIAI